MEGIHFVTDENGQKVAVQLDLERYADVWEDVYDQITAQRRAYEKREPLEAVKARLVRRGKLQS